MLVEFSKDGFEGIGVRTNKIYFAYLKQMLWKDIYTFCILIGVLFGCFFGYHGYTCVKDRYSRKKDRNYTMSHSASSELNV